MPLTARTAPAASRERAPATGSSPGDAVTPGPATSRRRGPQDGQATGCAWNRRSAGSWYSRAQSGHRGKRAIVVCSRSYGRPVTMVKRGPQCVQVTNGCRWRRSAGSPSSARQSSQVAVSGATSVRTGSPARDGTMRNPLSATAAIPVVSTDSTTASGGASGRRREQNRSTAAGGPSTSTTTPSPVLVTYPVSRRSVAIPYTKGRKPTPCTTPRTTTRARRTAAATSAGGEGAHACARAITGA
ncbi:hypothetical protein SHIRM173S_13143 [Streptomyces hirsutus]